MTKLLFCENCGNLIKTTEDTKLCCGKNMVEILPNTTEAATEKHIPVINQADNCVTLTVGEIIHPMTIEHYIKWIYLETDKEIKKVELKPNDEPTAKFTLLPDEKIISAYSYCNLHSLWQNNNL